MSREKRTKKFQEDFKALMSSPDMAVYLEPERKLDVATEEDLARVEAHIKRSKYYVPLNGVRSNHDIPDGIHVTVHDINNLKVPVAQETTPRRYRLYYDTPALDAYHGGIEIRIEFPKPTEHGHARRYKQVIKLGVAATEADPTFHRIEISGRLYEAIPSFESFALDRNKELSAFLKEYINCSSLRPLQLLTTVRSRYWCRPNGCENTVVEFGYDRGRAMTVNGLRYPLLQIEPEVLHGDEAILGEIGTRLTHRFNDKAAVNLHSKPTPGFDHLGGVLAGNRRAQEFLLELPRDEFRMISKRECPELHIPAHLQKRLAQG